MLRQPYSDVLAFPLEKDTELWVLTNVFAKTFLGLTVEGVRSWDRLRRGVEIPDHPEEKVVVTELHYFASGEGLLEDPTRIRRSDLPAPRELSVSEFRVLLCDLLLLIDDEEGYVKRFQAKTSLLDWEHLGNFHEQLGQHLIVQRRVSPESWWITQKFNQSLVELRENLYGSVQGPELVRYFSARMRAGERVLDIGCGTGFYSNLMSQSGAQVVGVDPSSHYIGVARTTFGAAAEFKVLDLPQGLSEFESKSFDRVFISDALLYYFHPIERHSSPDLPLLLPLLLSEIRRILKVEGVLTLVEPHPVFYQLPWLGSAERPFTVIAEYNSKKFGVVPTFSQLFSALFEAGFSIGYYKELIPRSVDDACTKRALAFATEFPVWHLIEANPNQKEV
jgi:SAM-dependent methyltransferase